jgi:membrane-associated phospholipid phosphatase
MSTDLETRRAAKSAAGIGRALAQAMPAFATLRRNVETTWSFLAQRRCDRRFPLQPYDGFQIANAAALVASALVILFAFADPYLPLWRARLPEHFIDFFRFFTQFGKADWILIITGVAVILALFTSYRKMRARDRASDAMRAFAAAYVFLAVAISGIIANLSKYIIGRARPKLFADNGSFAFDFWSWNADWASFPSGHATTGMALGVALALLFPRLAWIYLCLGFWIAASRPIAGVHYPSDMLAGGLLGGATAWLLARAFAQRRLIFGFDARGHLVRRNGASGRLTLGWGR